MNSFPFDYCARQLMGGIHLSDYIIRQLPVIPPDAYLKNCVWAQSEQLSDWVSSRITELTYTAWDLEPFAKDCGYDGPPFRWDEERRLLLRCELDAAFFHLYLPTEVNGDWSQVKDKEWESACMEVYAAMVDQMDQGIGRLVQALKARGELDNTLIFFLQDNGGCAENGGRGTKPFPRPEKPTFKSIPDDVVHYFGSVPKQTRDGYPVRRGHVMPGPEDTYIGYGRNWANVSNTPFREYKHWVHEGGVATPLIAHWPDGIAAKNKLRREPSHLVDLMATCVDVSGAKYPEKTGGKSIKPMEGRSLIPVFEGKSLNREAIYWEHEGNRAIRMDDWKLVAKGRQGQWELYNMKTDRVEITDLSKKYPERAAKLQTMWQTYAERANVIPWPESKKKNKNKYNNG